MKIDTSAWGEFTIEELFEVRKGTRLTKANMAEGEIRFVSAANANNGVTAHIGNNVHVHSEGTISVCYNGNGGTGKAFYQDSPYWASDDVHVLYPKFHLPRDFGNVEWTGLNPTVGLYLATVIEKVGRQKYGFTNKWKLEHMREDKIKLPVDDDGSPDWMHIHRYMKTIIKKVDDHRRAIKRINSLPAPLPTASWRPFRISDLFETETRNNRRQVPTGSWIAAKNLEEGDTPRVTVSNSNNGIVGYYADMDDPNYRVYENFISVSFLGTVFYQPRKTSLDMKVHCLKPMHITLNEYVANFLVTVIRSRVNAFKYQDQLSSTVLPNATIMLPANEAGSPDWNFMESFMRSIVNETSVMLMDCLHAFNWSFKPQA